MNTRTKVSNRCAFALAAIIAFAAGCASSGNAPNETQNATAYEIASRLAYISRTDMRGVTLTEEMRSYLASDAYFALSDVAGRDLCNVAFLACRKAVASQQDALTLNASKGWLHGAATEAIIDLCVTYNVEGIMTKPSVSEVPNVIMKLADHGEALFGHPKTRQPDSRSLAQTNARAASQRSKTLPARVLLQSIFASAERGDLDKVRRYLDNGAQVDATQCVKDSTSLIWVPDPNGSGQSIIVEQAPRGLTALMLAAGEGHADVVQLLLERRADVDAKEERGGTALMRAVAGGHAGIAKLLIETRANVNVEDNNGWTPLAIAASEHNLDMLKLLLDSGAAPNARNRNGKSAIDFAGTDQVKLLLRTAGEKK